MGKKEKKMASAPRTRRGAARGLHDPGENVLGGVEKLEARLAAREKATTRGRRWP